MVFKLLPNLKKEKGTTLVELIVVICIIGLFIAVLISNFPEILRQLALSRATYKLAQDLRKTEDLALSGVKLTDKNGNAISVNGYGVYFPAPPATQYVVYAYVTSQKYDGGLSFPLCSEQENPITDCVIEIINVSKENIDLSISKILNVSSGTNINNAVSISFIPPNPTTNLEGHTLPNAVYSAGVDVTLGLSVGSATRTVSVKPSGLISIK